MWYVHQDIIPVTSLCLRQKTPIGATWSRRKSCPCHAKRESRDVTHNPHFGDSPISCSWRTLTMHLAHLAIHCESVRTVAVRTTKSTNSTTPKPPTIIGNLSLRIGEQHYAEIRIPKSSWNQSPSAPGLSLSSAVYAISRFKNCQMVFKGDGSWTWLMCPWLHWCCLFFCLLLLLVF